jgi:hypothetical protein
VVDTTAPVVTLNGAATMTVECHTSFSDPGATASDACAGSLPVTPSGSVNVNVPGSYTLTYSANDGNGHTGTASRTVNVVDTTAPAITCPANMTVCTSSNSANVTFSPSALDACSGSVTITATPASGSSFALGTTTVTVRADDGNGNTNVCTFDVTVFKATAPTIVNMSYSGGAFSFDFASQNGCTYIVEYRSLVDSGSWTTLTTVSGDGSVKHVVDSNPTVDPRFYRVRVE